MKRIHLFEWEDLPWFPTVIRNLMTDFLRHMVILSKMYKPVIPILERLMQDTKTSTVVDLASGGGGPWSKLASELRENNPNFKVILTDLYPNTETLEFVKSTAPDAIEVEQESVNALCVPQKYKGIRTQFLSLHHFKPPQVKEIFKSAIDANQPIAIFEFQERSLSYLIQFMFSPLLVLLTAAFIRPFSWKRILFTYLIPLVPLFILWDGVISVFRTYKPQEIKEIIQQIPNSQSYTWDIASKKSGPITVVYATGRPT